MPVENTKNEVKDQVKKSKKLLYSMLPNFVIVKIEEGMKPNKIMKVNKKPNFNYINNSKKCMI